MAELDKRHERNHSQLSDLRCHQVNSADLFYKSNDNHPSTTEKQVRNPSRQQ